MKNLSKTISMMQLSALYILAAIVPLIRAVPIKLAETSGKSAWIATILMILPSIILVFILNTVINKLKNKDGTAKEVKTLDEVFVSVFGNIIGKIVSVIYVVWMMLLAALELRLFAERFISTMLIHAPLPFFLITMCMLVFFLARGKISTYGKFAEIMIELFIVVFLFIGITSISDIEVSNLMPNTIYSLKNVAMSSLQVFSVFSIFTYSLFLGDKVVDRNKLKKIGIFTAIAISVIGCFIVILIIGTFGSNVTAILSQPFFMALKVINLFGVLERLEAIFITFWVAADFAIISYYVLASTNIFKHQFKLSKRQVLITPVIFIIYVLSILLAKNYFSLEILSSGVIMPFNLVFGAIIPILVYIVAKCRKMIS